MEKAIFYLPAIIFTLFYGAAVWSKAGSVLQIAVVWVVLWVVSGIILSKDYAWGSLPGMLPAIHLVYMGTQETGQIINEAPIGMALLVFYALCGGFVYRKAKRS